MKRDVRQLTQSFPLAFIGEPSPISRNRLAYLRRTYCRRQANYLWGQKRIIKPVLLPVQFGDGRQVIAVRPITTRTHHYVVAINSSPNWFSRDCSETLHDSDMAAKADAQVWLETSRTDAPVSVIMDDGHIQGEQPPQPAPAKEPQQTEIPTL